LTEYFGYVNNDKIQTIYDYDTIIKYTSTENNTKLFPNINMTLSNITDITFNNDQTEIYLNLNKDVFYYNFDNKYLHDFNSINVILN